jgi:hypothetical protein
MSIMIISSLPFDKALACCLDSMNRSHSTICADKANSNNADKATEDDHTASITRVFNLTRTKKPKATLPSRP